MSFLKKLFGKKTQVDEEIQLETELEQEIESPATEEEAEETQEIQEQVVEAHIEELVNLTVIEDQVDEVIAEVPVEEVPVVEVQTGEMTEEDAVEEIADATLGVDTAEVKEKKPGFFSKLVQGLTKTRNNILDGVDNVLKSFTKIDEELYEELEEALIMADIGVATTMEIMEELQAKVKENKTKDPAELKDMIVTIISEKISQGEHGLNIVKGVPTVILVIGVNGVGKTTTIGKLANQIKKQNNKVLIAAADTFRAAAIEQLEIWGERSKVDVIKHYEGADPAAVIYDALQAAKARKTDVLICDTAGRLHNKANLMKELEKIFKVINREYPEANKEVLLVLDATTGQNAIQQVKQFKEAADITGIVLTKLDGTAKGGIIIGIHSTMGIPVKFVGVGEGIDDLQAFNPDEFSKALFGR